MKKTSYRFFRYGCGFLLLCSLSSISAQRHGYASVDEYDLGARLGVFFVSSTSLYIHGEGFRDVEISDYETNPDNPNTTPLRLSDANFASFQTGLSLGFVSMKDKAWGLGVEGDLLIFDNPSIMQFAAFVNYSLFGGENYLIGPYAKLGYTTFSYELQKVRSPELIELSLLERNRGKDAVDLRDGDRLSLQSEAIYLQFGLHFLIILQPNFSLFAQIGYQNEINVSKGLRLETEGVRRDKISGLDQQDAFHMDLDDASLVELGTNTPARLTPELNVGPWYLSLGVAYTFAF